MTQNPPHDVPISPADMLIVASNIAVKKANSLSMRLFLLSILAGVYIAFGALFASLLGTGATGVWPYGVVKLLQGLVFSLGLILVVVGGAELFTGNNLMIIAWLDRKLKLVQILRNWMIVYVGNFIGSILLAFAVLFSKEYLSANGSLGATMVSTAITKVNYDFGQAIILGILCNILVCLAVWLTYSAKSTTDKILSIIFPITFFVAAGFEHSVANMYSIPVALLIKWLDPSFMTGLTLDVTQLTWTSFLFNNLLPVTIGNILGGSFFVGLIYFLVYRKTE